MLRCEGITKSYGNRQIFHDLNYRLTSGIYAVQGHNGIGKSTLLGIMSGAIEADKGDVWINDISMSISPVSARQLVSYVPDESPIYPFMTGQDLLNFVAMAKKANVDSNIMQLVERFGLTTYINSRFSTMSLGTQKKFMLCAAWIGDPTAIFLDEPSNGLDIDARELLARLIQTYREPRLIVFATHDIDFISACHAKVLNIDQSFAANL